MPVSPLGVSDTLWSPASRRNMARQPLEQPRPGLAGQRQSMVAGRRGIVNFAVLSRFNGRVRQNSLSIGRRKIRAIVRSGTQATNCNQRSIRTYRANVIRRIIARVRPWMPPTTINSQLTSWEAVSGHFGTFFWSLKLLDSMFNGRNTNAMKRHGITNQKLVTITSKHDTRQSPSNNENETLPNDLALPAQMLELFSFAHPHRTYYEKGKKKQLYRFQVTWSPLQNQVSLWIRHLVRLYTWLPKYF